MNPFFNRLKSTFLGCQMASFLSKSSVALLFAASFIQAQEEINCAENEDCKISCSASSCAGKVINCPQNGGCFIKCDDSNVCRNTKINWVDGQPNSITCEDSFTYTGKGCTKCCNDLDGIKSYQQTQDFTFDCYNAIKQCSGATFYCPYVLVSGIIERTVNKRLCLCVT